MKYDLYTMLELLDEYEKAIIEKANLERRMFEIRDEFNIREIDLNKLRKKINGER